MDLQDESLHPNWVALATVKFKPKLFIKSSGTEDDNNVEATVPAATIEIDESASRVYNEILQMPSTARQAEVKEKKARKRRKIVKQTFDKQNFFKLALADDSDGLEGLLERSIDPDVNATDAYGWTALMMAACEGSARTFQTLLEHGADLTVTDRKGNNATTLAQKKNRQEVLEITEEFKRHCESIEISDEESPEQGTQFCSDCGIEISKSSSKSHQTSTVHLFSCKFKGNTNIKTFGIARTNRGFQMMRRTGWDGNSALGARQNGKLYPIKTVIRKSRTGLGTEQNPARITHFKANDPSGVHFKPPPRALTRKEIHENDLRDKRRDQKLRRDLS